MSRSAVRVRSSALQECGNLQVNRRRDEAPTVSPGLLYTNPYTNADGSPFEGVFIFLGLVLIVGLVKGVVHRTHGLLAYAGRLPRRPQATTRQISSLCSCFSGLEVHDALISEAFKVPQVLEGFEERRIVVDTLQGFSRKLECAT